MQPVISEATLNAADDAEALIQFRRDNPRSHLRPSEIRALIEQARAPKVRSAPQEAALEEALAVVSQFDEVTSLLLDELEAAGYRLRQNPPPGPVAVACDLQMIFEGLLRIMRNGYNPTPLLRVYAEKCMPLLRDKVTGKVPPDVASAHVPFAVLAADSEALQTINEVMQNPSTSLTASLIASRA